MYIDQHPGLVYNYFRFQISYHINVRKPQEKNMTNLYLFIFCDYFITLLFDIN